MPDYNPQANTPLKPQAPKTCPTCGQLVHPPVTQLQHHMNHYINPITGVTVVISSNEPEHIISGVKMIRADLHKPVKAQAVVTTPDNPNKPQAPIPPLSAATKDAAIVNAVKAAGQATL